MLTQSHVYIAKAINKKSGKDFNHNYFYLGNIAPDFIHFHQKKKHEFKYSFLYILDEIDSLEKITDINLVSYKMGIITHYLADFFCKAHNCDRLLNNLWQHFQYESLLHRLLISTKNEVQVNKKISNIETFLKEKYESYLIQEPSMAVDIIYSLEACQGSVNYILQNMNKDLLKQIA